MTNKGKFVRNMGKTGKVSSDQWVLFLLEHYFMKGLDLDAYEEDLEIQYGYSEGYAVACHEQAKDGIKDFVKRHKETSETWEQEINRKGIKEYDRGAKRITGRFSNGATGRSINYGENRSHEDN